MEVFIGHKPSYPRKEAKEDKAKSEFYKKLNNYMQVSGLICALLLWQ
jgi:hypothetical protein